MERKLEKGIFQNLKLVSRTEDLEINDENKVSKPFFYLILDK
jgi:hypothetical protein